MAQVSGKKMILLPLTITGVSGFPSNTAKTEELKKVAKSFVVSGEYSNEIQKTINAILDAGYHPSDLEGTKTGVYVGTPIPKLKRESLAKSISKFFKLKGASFATENPFFALSEAVNDLRNGKCDSAVIFGSEISKYFWTDSPENEVKNEESYDCFLLEKKRSRNEYSWIFHSKTIINESGVVSIQEQLDDFYKECKINAKPINFSGIMNGNNQTNHGFKNGHQANVSAPKCIISREIQEENVTAKAFMVLSNFDSKGGVAHVLFKRNSTETSSKPDEKLINSSVETKQPETDPGILFGRKLANPPPGEEVCVTGLAGTFPNSDDVAHFTRNLFTKTDMIDDDERRWPKFHAEIPQRTGKVPTLSQLDAGYFGIHHNQAQEMDPGMRLLYEKTIEAIFDAGLNPADLEGTNTGLFLGMCWTETETELFFSKLHAKTYAVTGNYKSFIANRISYLLKLNGPSIVVDTACSSSSYTFENAYAALRKGQMDQAIVMGCNLCLHPMVSLQFFRLGVLSPEGRCASFDENGNGYCRSEAACVMLLQKRKNAKRVYAKVMHAKTNCDGFKDSGITFPSRDLQQQLLEEFYNECDEDPKSLTYLEAHATGTKVGDPEEFHAIDTVFIKGRKTPLYTGSIKSNIGHTEPVSGLCSITKCIIAMETGYIPPNLHYNRPRPEFTSILEGRCVVVSEKTPLPDNNGLMAVSSFGFGGANAHILIKWNEKSKINGGKPADDIPRLVCVSGRVPEAIPSMLKDVHEKYDAEHIRLLHECFRKNVENHRYRGYAIVSKEGGIKSSVKQCSTLDPKVLMVALGNFYETWQILTRTLMKFPVFNATINEIKKILVQVGVNFDELMKKSTISSKIVGSAVLQIGIIEMFKTLEIKVNSVVGYSIGVIASEYYKNALSLKEALSTAFEIGKYLENDTNAYYVVPMLPEQLPKNVEPVRKYSETQTVITGKGSAIGDFVKNINGKGDVFELGIDGLLEFSVSGKLNKIAPNLKIQDFSANTLAAAISSKLYSESFHLHDSVLLEIGHGKLLEVLAPTLSNFKMITRLNYDLNQGKDGIVALLEILGDLYENGIDMHLHKIYPEIQFPVSRGTPMISNSLKWNHSKKWWVMDFRKKGDVANSTKVQVSTANPDWEFVKGHVIDGRNLFPATGYLHLVFSVITRNNSGVNVVFENCKFNRATTVSSKKVEFCIQIHDVSGYFEVCEGDVTVVSGRVRITERDEQVFSNIPIPPDVKDEIPLSSRDVYKELRLRGYNYSGAFRKIKECNQSATKATVKWDGEFISFMDNMLQLSILQEDSRLLCVPTEIKYMAINDVQHLSFVEKFGENPELEVHVNKEAGIMRCGAIEIRGLKATPISRKKETTVPILENYEFVPNEAATTLENSLKINMQIALENLYVVKFPVVEIIDEETAEEAEPLGPIIFEKFSEQPLIQPNVTVLGKKIQELPNVTVDSTKTLKDIADAYLIIGSNLLQRSTLLQQIFGSLREGGFVLTREEKNSPISADGIDILTTYVVGEEKQILFRKSQEKNSAKNVTVKITNGDFSWIESLQNEIKAKSNIVIYSENEEANGVLGLFNCIKREYPVMDIKCVIVHGENVPTFDLNHPFYKNQMGRNMNVNIFKDGKWGTYRHLTLECAKSLETESEHCFVSTTQHGDLSSLRWLQGPLSSKSILTPEKTLVHVYYSALNFRDIMIATGRIQGNKVSRFEQDFLLGFEFAGRDSNSRRVIGFSAPGAISTLVPADKYLLFEIPDNWTMAEAASVPAVYSTVIYALLDRGKLKRGESILIHSGTGGVGQAAINVALFFGCKVFTTVGTPEKRQLIKKLFPELTDNQIGNSRDISFEKMIKKETGGRGVDLVLNSLAEEKLLATARCLAKQGRFLEIGKFDLESNNKLALTLLKKECSFHGVMLDQFFTAHPLLKNYIAQLLTDGMKKGYVKPIQTNVFKMDQVEEAFRMMAAGKHTGKVLIQIREEESDKSARPTPIISKSVFRYSCDSSKSYIIMGGLGGFGLELADWLIIRGARKLVLTSRTGVKTGYQTYRLRIWKSYGVQIKISTVDVTTKEGCEQLISEAEELGPVSSLFNLAVVLKDDLFENQNEEMFRTSLGPKAVATMYLDEVTRKRCPDMKDFVIFSSVSCGRGNAGQTNYGMANSIMERICESRKKDGFPALAVEWGAIGDVGLVAEMQENHTQIEIGGTLQQTISSCLQVLNKFLGQDEAAVVSSIVVAEKKNTNANSMVDAIADIIGVNIKTVSTTSTLAELGMDSMTATEIKQTLERDFEVFLTAQDIKSLTLAKLMEMQEDSNKKSSSGAEHQMTSLELMLGDMRNVKLDQSAARLPSLIEDDDSSYPYIFFFPGIEGVATILKGLSKKIKAKVVAVQWSFVDPKGGDYDHLAEVSVNEMQQYINSNDKVHIVAHSWGGIIALETMSRLEKMGYTGTLTLIDSSPDMLKEMLSVELSNSAGYDVETVVMCLMIIALKVPLEKVIEIRESMSKCKTLEERAEIYGKETNAYGAEYSEESRRAYSTIICKRLENLMAYEAKFEKIKSETFMYKPTTPTINNPEKVGDDYNIGKYCENIHDIKVLNGDHVTMVNEDVLADSINELLSV